MRDGLYSKQEVAKELDVSIYTITNWYKWESKLIRTSEIKQRFLPIPTKIRYAKGQPNYWSFEQIEQLREFKDNMIKGRNGMFGKFTNPKHKN